MAEYVRGKITLTRLERRENIARYFMVAVRDNFKMPGQSQRSTQKRLRDSAQLQKKCGKSSKSDPVADSN
jgi:hypothetical protein